MLTSKTWERGGKKSSMWQLQKDPIIKAAKGSLWLRNQDILASPALTWLGTSHVHSKAWVSTCIMRDSVLLNRTPFVEMPFALINLLNLTLWAESLHWERGSHIKMNSQFRNRFSNKLHPDPPKADGTTCEKLVISICPMWHTFHPSGKCKAIWFYLLTSKATRSWNPSSLESVVAF